MAREVIEYSEKDLPQENNAWLDKNPSDYLYHFWFDKNGVGIEWALKWKSLEEIFWDVTHVCMGGSPERAENFAHTLHREMNPDSERIPVEPIWKTERFSLFKVWSVISVSHGMGMPSMSILLHEITKMLYYAKWKDIWRLRNEVSFIRIGTSGWVWVDAGTVVVSEKGINPTWEAWHEEIVMWNIHRFPTLLNSNLSAKILTANIQEEVWKQITVVLWDTVGTDDFYEWQGRIDGFFAP